MPFLEKIFNFLFPPRCVGCDNFSSYLCQKCRVALPRAKTPGHKEIEALFEYRAKAMQGLIWKLKYKNARAIAKILGESLYEHMLLKISDLTLFSGAKRFLLVPIPLSPQKLRLRGFNQMELVGREMEKLDHKKTLEYTPYVLVKTRHTKPQMEIRKKEERLANVIGSFAVSDIEKVRGQNIILIDDVTTTGATLLEARKVLLEAGARNVFPIAIAH